MVHAKNHKGLWASFLVPDGAKLAFGNWKRSSINEVILECNLIYLHDFFFFVQAYRMLIV